MNSRFSNGSMPRTFLIRSNIPAVQCPAPEEDLLSATTHGEGRFFTSDVEAGFQDADDGPIDLSMSGSEKSLVSSLGSSQQNVQESSNRLTHHERPSWIKNVTNNGGGIHTKSPLDKFALPTQTYERLAIPDNHHTICQEDISQELRSDLKHNKFDPDCYSESFPFDNGLAQSGDTFTQDYSSKRTRNHLLSDSEQSMKTVLLTERANDRLFSLKDLTRIVIDETGRYPNPSSCMTLLKTYYLDAVAKRDVVLNLLRELHTSSFQEPDFRHSTFPSSRDHQHFRHTSAEPSGESLMGNSQAVYGPLGTDSNHTPGVIPEVLQDTVLDDIRSKAYGPEVRINSNHNSSTTYGNGDANPRTFYSEPMNPPAIKSQCSPKVWQYSGKVAAQSSQGLNGTIPQPMSIEARSSRGTHLKQQPQYLSTMSNRQVPTSRSSEGTNAPSFRKQNNPVHENIRFSKKDAVTSTMNIIQPNELGVPPVSRPVVDPQSSVTLCMTTKPMPEYTVLGTAIPAGKSSLKCKETSHLKDTLDVSTVFTSTPQSNDIDSGSSTDKRKPETGNGLSAPSAVIVKEHLIQTSVPPDSTSLLISDSPSSAEGDLQFRRRTFDRSKQKHRCSACCSTFETDRAYTRHMATEHNQKRTHICSFCGKGFQDKFDLKRHHRTHTGVRPYKCNICTRTFTQRCSLETHINKVHGMPLNFGFKERRKKIYVCEDCGNSAKDAYDHYLHMWISHSRLAMPKRLLHKVMHRIRKVSKNGRVKSEEELLSDDAVVTQAIRCLRDIVGSQG